MTVMNKTYGLSCSEYIPCAATVNAVGASIMTRYKISSLLRMLVVVLVLSFTSLVTAFDWPDQVEVGQLLVLDAPPDVACAWGVSGQDVDGAPYEPVWREFPGALVVSTQHGGLLTVSLTTDANRGLRNVTWCVAVGDDDGPDPGPDPIPPPPGKIFAVMIEETGDRDEYTPEQIQALIAKGDLDYMKAKGYLYRKVDQHVVEPDGQGGDRTPLAIASFLQRGKNQHLPRLIIADDSGAVLYDDVVADEASVLRTLKQYGGE